MSSERDPFAALRGRLRARRPRHVRAPAGSQSSVAVILAAGRAPGPAVLLMERALRPQDPWSGHIALPGGRREPSDADRLATCLRETLEETGAALRREDLLGELDEISPRTPTYPRLSVRPFVFGMAARPALRPGPEAADLFWVGLACLPATRGEETFQIAGRPARLPAFRIGARVVWGITYRILGSLLDLLN